jgi:DNA-directed RNA polymerase specialized sigma subunit
MSYQTIYREKTKKFNTNKEDILNTRGKIDLDIVDEDYCGIVDMDGFEKYDMLDELLSTLSEREKKIMDLRMDGLTWEVIGQNIINVNTGEYGISKGRVTMIHDKAMRKMRYLVRHN